MRLEPVRVLLAYSYHVPPEGRLVNGMRYYDAAGVLICQVGDGAEAWQPVDFFPFEDPWPTVGRTIRHTAFKAAMRRVTKEPTT